MQFTFPTAITSDPRAGALATINSRRLSHEPKKQGPNGKRENRENRGLRNAQKETSDEQRAVALKPAQCTVEKVLTILKYLKSKALIFCK